MNTLRNLLRILTAGLVFWLMGLGVVLAVSSLLHSVGDAAGAAVVRYVALGVGIFAILDLILLVLVLAMLHLASPDGDA
ncbi:MAG: hypothetical protein ACUVTW_05355 [Thermogutta sp.]